MGSSKLQNRDLGILVHLQCDPHKILEAAGEHVDVKMLERINFIS